MKVISADDINQNDIIMCYRGEMVDTFNPISPTPIYVEDTKWRGQLFKVMGVDLPFMVVVGVGDPYHRKHVIRTRDFLWAKPSEEFLSIITGSTSKNQTNSEPASPTNNELSDKVQNALKKQKGI